MSEICQKKFQLWSLDQKAVRRKIPFSLFHSKAEKIANKKVKSFLDHCFFRLHVCHINTKMVAPIFKKYVIQMCKELHEGQYLNAPEMTIYELKEDSQMLSKIITKIANDGIIKMQNELFSEVDERFEWAQYAFDIVEECLREFQVIRL